jgi:hypothetical protein
LREGNLLETLEVDEGMPPEIDMLLLDSEFPIFTQKAMPFIDLLIPVWCPLALPTLKIVKPKLRRGSLILVDNTTWAKPMYKDLFDYLHDPKNEFLTTTAPYKGGFEIATYLPL